MTDDLEERNEKLISRKEQVTIGTFLVLIGCFGFYAVYEDWIEGVSVSHLVIESLLNIIQLFGGIYLLYQLLRSNRSKIEKLRSKYLEARSAAAEYSSQVTKLQDGITEAILSQFKVWRLSRAEEDICLLVLKGFTFKEIADLRNTSERTIRHQASSMYKKSGLDGRAQLSAFFLEDMLK